MTVLAEEKTSMTKDEFRSTLKASKQLSVITEKEVDLLFNTLDISRDGYVDSHDFRSLQALSHELQYTGEEYKQSDAKRKRKDDLEY